MRLQWIIPADKTLDKLKAALKKRILSKAVRAASKLLRDELKETMPKRTGALRTSISVKISAKKGKVTGIVGPRSNFVKSAKGRLNVPAWYEHFLERGTKYITARRPLAKAMARNRYRCLNVIRTEVAAGISETLPK